MAPKEPPLCYIESCVYLDLIKQEEAVSKHDNKTPRWRMARDLFDQVKSDNITLATSPLVIVEVGFKPQDDPKKQEILESLKKLMYRSKTRWIDIERTVADLAIAEGADWADRKADSSSNKMKPNDAIHLAAAIRLGARYFLTSDGGFPIGETIHGVEVTYGRPIGSQSLDLE